MSLLSTIMMDFCLLFLKQIMSLKQNSVKDDKVHQLFLSSSLHKCPRVVFVEWQMAYYMTLSHHLNWDLNEFDHVQTWSSSKFKHIQTTASQVSMGWFELIWTSPVIRNGRFQIMNNPRYPLFPLFNEFQMGNGFTRTPKTTLGHLWKLENRRTLPSLTFFCLIVGGFKGLKS